MADVPQAGVQINEVCENISAPDIDVLSLCSGFRNVFTVAEWASPCTLQSRVTRTCKGPQAAQSIPLQKHSRSADQYLTELGSSLACPHFLRSSLLDPNLSQMNPLNTRTLYIHNVSSNISHLHAQVYQRLTFFQILKPNFCMILSVVLIPMPAACCAVLSPRHTTTLWILHCTKFLIMPGVISSLFLSDSIPPPPVSISQTPSSYGLSYREGPGSTPTLKEIKLQFLFPIVAVFQEADRKIKASCTVKVRIAYILL